MIKLPRRDCAPPILLILLCIIWLGATCRRPPESPPVRIQVDVKEFWDFSTQSGVPSEFTEVEGGAGAVSITSNHLRIDNGGTASGDYAATVFQTSVDMSKVTVVMAEFKGSGDTGAWVPSVVGFWDSSSEPTAMSAASRDAALRMWMEWQMQSGPGGTTSDRVLGKIKQADGTNKWWNGQTGGWTNTFNVGTVTHRELMENCYYRYVLVIDGTTSPDRARFLIFGSTDTGGSKAGWNLRSDSDWADFDTGTNEIDPVDNSLWIVLGDLTNSDTRSDQVILDFRRVMIGEMNSNNIEEFAFTNRYDGSGGFPLPYEISEYINPMPDSLALWVNREDAPNEALIGPGAEDWVKDPFCFYDGATYWLFYQIRDAGDGDSDIWAVSLGSDILSPSVGTPSEIASTGTGQDKLEFPWVTKYDGTWHLFYGIENDDTTWEIGYRASTSTNPTSGFGSETIVLSESGIGGAFDEDGVSSPFLVWHSGTFTGGTWYMSYAGADNGSAKWEGGLATSTTGITGTWSRVDTDPWFPVGTFSTTVNGGQDDSDRSVTVASTSGAAAGMSLHMGTSNLEMNEIISVDDGTTLTIAVNVSLGDGEEVNVHDYESFYPRVLKQINGDWVVYGTGFKDSDGREWVTAQIDANAATDLSSSSFRDLRFGDSFHNVVPIVDLRGNSNENFSGVFSELSPVVASAAATGTRGKQTSRWWR